VILHGRGFRPGTHVYFGSVEAPGAVVVDRHTISVPVPPVREVRHARAAQRDVHDVTVPVSVKSDDGRATVKHATSYTYQ
jgi:hypothetical protein